MFHYFLKHITYLFQYRHLHNNPIDQVSCHHLPLLPLRTKVYLQDHQQLYKSHKLFCLGEMERHRVLKVSWALVLLHN